MDNMNITIVTQQMTPFNMIIPCKALHWSEWELYSYFCEQSVSFINVVFSMKELGDVH